ncbi:CHAT domain-containing protein [Antribacter gilvus]|uniref:CHAT domain-containing protein n=1 Tax=Antribacter gilvus TaxID=2304675 RepID=UPI0013DF3EE3|nr:CHAT domain-containing protein [Antribacter gilvus]
MRAREILDRIPRDDPGTPLTFRLQRYVATAELAFAEGDRRRGLRAVREGFALLAEHRSRLGSVESVTAAAVHGVELQWVDVRAALKTGRAAALFDALERGRAVGAGAGRVTPPDDPEAAALLTEARGLLAKARELPATGGRAVTAEREALTRKARRIQAEVRERSWRHAGETVADRAVTAREVSRLLAARDDGAVVANYSVVDGQLRAVRIGARGTTMLHLGPIIEIAERVRRVRADLVITANDLIPAPLRAAARGSLERSLKALDEALVAPLGACGDLYVATREPLLSIPWSALPSRAGRRTSVRSYVARGRHHAAPTGGRRIFAAAGPGVDEGDTEARAVGAVWAGAVLDDVPAAAENNTVHAGESASERDVVLVGQPGTVAERVREVSVLTGAAATTAAVREALATSDVVHLAAHGQHDVDNPLFASIELADGPLFAHELDGLRLPDSVIVLSSCEVGGHTAVLGGEVLGLTSVLLRLGARAVIASVAPLSDALAAEVMPRLHEHLRDTDDPEAALAAAIADVAEPVPLVCFGSVEGLTS